MFSTDLDHALFQFAYSPFTVPSITVQPSYNCAAAGIWVGIGGGWGDSLIQAGVALFSNSTAVSYAPFYQYADGYQGALWPHFNVSG
jgi:hypothetical protein